MFYLEYYKVLVHFFKSLGSLFVLWSEPRLSFMLKSMKWITRSRTEPKKTLFIAVKNRKVVFLNSEIKDSYRSYEM